MCSSAKVGGKRADTIQELADALDIPWRQLPFFPGYGRKNDSWAGYCLCGVNIPLAAKRNGYTCEQDEWDGMGYVLTKKDPTPPAWRPIAEAPRDLVVLCWTPGNPNAELMAPRVPQFRIDRIDDAGRWWREYPEAPYTHFMPLPPPPETAP